jgi:hypothetical protein
MRSNAPLETTPPLRVLGIPRASTTHPPRNSKSHPARNPRSSPDRSLGNGLGSGTHPANRPAPVTLTPSVRTVRIGQETGDHPLRPITEASPEPTQDPTQIAGAVVRAAVEVLDGRRPLNQIRSWITPEVAAQLGERSRLELAVARPDRVLGTIKIRRVHLVRFGDRAEATVILDSADRVRAAAARLEAQQGTWRVSVLEIA